MLTTPTETPLTDQYTIQVRLGQTDVYEMLSAFDRLELKLNRALDAIAGLLPFAHAYSDHPKRNPDDKLNERTDKARAILREAGRIK